MNLQDLVYEWPKAAYLLFLVVLFVILFVGLYLFRKHSLERYAEPQLLRNLMFPRSESLFWIKSGLFCLIWILATLALMKPVSFGEYPEELRTQDKVSLRQHKPHDVIILIDSSASMSVKDTSDGATRLDQAKEIADQIVSGLGGDSVALYAFTSELTQISPLTMDYLFVRLVLQRLQINNGGIPGTDFAKVLQEVKQRDFPKQSETLKTLIIISDGGDTHYESLKGEDRTHRLAEILKPISDAKSQHLHVLTVGVGSQQGGDVPGVSYEGKAVHSALDETLLQAISNKGNGHFFAVGDHSSMGIASDVKAEMNKSVDYTMSGGSQAENLIHKRYFQIPLGIAILLLAWILLFPDSFVRVRSNE